MSCDLLPTESDGPHYQGDLFDVIDTSSFTHWRGELMVDFP